MLKFGCCMESSSLITNRHVYSHPRTSRIVQRCADYDSSKKQRKGRGEKSQEILSIRGLADSREIYSVLLSPV